MRTLPSDPTLANMVFRVLLCNWLIAAFAAGAFAQTKAAPVRIVVFGDSLVAGFQLKASDAFPAQLERALKAKGHAVDVINAGVSGDTTANGLERLRGGLVGEQQRQLSSAPAGDGHPDQSTVLVVQSQVSGGRVPGRGHRAAG